MVHDTINHLKRLIEVGDGVQVEDIIVLRDALAFLEGYKKAYEEAEALAKINDAFEHYLINELKQHITMNQEEL